MAYNTLTIANGAATSTALALGQTASAVVIEFPAAFTGATVAIHGTVDGTNYKPVYYAGAALSVTVTVSTIHVLPAEKLLGLSSIKLVSASNEAAARSILATNSAAV